MGTNAVLNSQLGAGSMGPGRPTKCRFFFLPFKVLVPLENPKTATAKRFQSFLSTKFVISFIPALVSFVNWTLFMEDMCVCMCVSMAVSAIKLLVDENRRLRCRRRRRRRRAAYVPLISRPT